MLFDAHFWTNYVPPSPDEGAAPAHSPGSGGKHDRGPAKTVDVRKHSDAAFMGLFNNKR